SRHALEIARKRIGQDLDRHFATELGVCRSIDLAHAAFAEFGGDSIMRDCLRSHLPPDGRRRRTSSNQFSSTVKVTLPPSPTGLSAAGNHTMRLASRAGS